MTKPMSKRNVESTGYPAPPLGTPAPRPLEFVQAGDFVYGFKAPEYLVDGVCQRRFIYSFTGRTGSGKTAVALALALAVASGRPFAGHAVDQGRVLYCAAENPDDVRMRVIMAAEDAGLEMDTATLYFLDRPVDVTTCAEQIRERAEEIGGLALVIVDTAAAFFGAAEGDDENSNTQLGDFARALRSLCTLPGGPCVLVCTHPTKNAGKSNLVPRGGGAFLAEVDGNLSCWNDEGTIEMHWQGKFRGVGFEPMTFRLETRKSETVVDAKGRQIPSVIALPLSEEEAQRAAAAVHSDEDSLMMVMKTNPGASIAEWCANLGWVSQNGVPNKARVARILQRLADDKLVIKKRGSWELTSAGKREIGNDF